MEREIRIYFESIEQVNHFILPAIVKALKKIKLEIPIKLVKLRGNYKYYGRKIAPIIYWKDFSGKWERRDPINCTGILKCCIYGRS